MTKLKKVNTEEKILEKTLELFNQKGVEYVGMRELASALDTKLGNITYYFPTKEDLIVRLSVDLSALNDTILEVDNKVSILSFLETLRMHFKVQYRYRFLFISFVNLLRQYPKLAERYKKIEQVRKDTALKNIAALVENKYLNPLSDSDTEFLLSALLFVSRFWLSEAAISHDKLNPADQTQYYVNLLANIISDYTTEMGKVQIAEFLRN